MAVISESMIRHYLSVITVGWFNQHGVPPSAVSEYDHYVEEMRKSALKRGDLDSLRLAFEYLLSNATIDTERFNGGRYPYDNEELREIIQYAWRTIWPNAPAFAEGTPGVEIREMPLEEWWSRRG